MNAVISTVVGTVIALRDRIEAQRKADQEARAIAIYLAAKMLAAKIRKDRRNKELCTCLEVIGDHPPCPVHK